MTTGPANGNGVEGAVTASGVAHASPAVDPVAPDLAVADPAISERYRVIETLARGPRDALYVAQRLDTGSSVELRVLSAELAADARLEHALREQAALVARVSSHCPGIAGVYECERAAGGALVLTMEHPQGPTLREVIRREGTLPLERALRLAIQIARALERAHNLSLIHGGLRPDNIVLAGSEQTAVLTHFGFDRLLGSHPAAAGRNGAVPEDSVYQAPEQASGRATERSDIYAFGAVVYQMLAGAPPSRGSAARRLVSPKPLRKVRPDVPPRVERLIMQTLQAAPERRPLDISVVCNDLWVEITSAEGQQMPGRGIGGRLAGKRTRRFVVGGALAVIGALAVWFAHARVPSGPSPSAVRRPLPAPLATPPPEATAPVAAAPLPGGVPAPRTPDRPEPVARSASPPARSPDVRDGRKAPAGVPSPSRIGAPAKPAEATEAGRRDRDTPADPSSRADEVTSAERENAAGVSRPEPSPAGREPAGDPGAIIDWLLKEGAGQRR